MVSEMVDVDLSRKVELTAIDVGRSHSTVREQVTPLLGLIIWFGLLTGFVEVSLLVARKLFLHHFMGVFVIFNPDMVWMAPLFDLVLFTIVGLALATAGLIWPKLMSLRVAGVACAFLTFLSMLLTIQRLHLYAQLPLAAGLAVVSVRFLGARGRGFQSIFWRTSKWMLALVIASFIGVQGWHRLAEKRSLAALPPPPPNAPNVLLITLDTVRAQSLSLHGYSRPTTPQLERISKSGVRFDQALVTAPWTLPSHASMFTGRFANELSTDWYKPLDATFPTLAEALSKQGYATAGFVANLYYCNSSTGLERGFVHYEDYPISFGQIILSSALGERIFNSDLRHWVGSHDDLNRKSAALLNSDFLKWISQNDDRPFFAFLNYFDAHEPFLPPAPFATAFGPKGRPKKNTNMSPTTSWTEAEIALERDAYDGSIAYLDQQIGLLFDELQRRGKLANTLVVITSDHGEELNEHGIMGHGYDVYMPTLHVPLLILMPSQVPAGKIVTEVVSLADLPATVMDILKVKVDPHFSGDSLARYWDGTRISNSGVAPVLTELNFAPNLPASFPVSKGEMKSLVADSYHYIRNGDGSEELYNLETDPGEARNLSSLESERQQLDRFRPSLKTIVLHH